MLHASSFTLHSPFTFPISHDDYCLFVAKLPRDQETRDQCSMHHAVHSSTKHFTSHPLYISIGRFGVVSGRSHISYNSKYCTLSEKVLTSTCALQYGNSITTGTDDRTDSLDVLPTADLVFQHLGRTLTSLK
jgi:hypothetical protein